MRPVLLGLRALDDARRSHVERGDIAVSCERSPDSIGDPCDDGDAVLDRRVGVPELAIAESNDLAAPHLAVENPESRSTGHEVVDVGGHAWDPAVVKHDPASEREGFE